MSATHQANNPQSTQSNYVPPKFGRGLFKLENWLRGLYMLIFFLLYNVAEVVILAIALFQIGSRVLSGECNPRLLELGNSLSVYTYQVMRFLTYNSEELPYPFSDWPPSNVQLQILPKSINPPQPPSVN